MNEIFDRYEFERYTKEDGTPALRVYNNQARKEWKRLIAHYRFLTIESREKYIQEVKDNWQKRLDYMAEKKAERVNFVNPAKVGDILYSSWGYDQTNIDYYEVVEVKGKQVVIRELAQKANETLWLQGDCMPVTGQYTGEPITKMVRPAYDDTAYQVRMNSFASAWLWDGKPKHYTAYA